MKNNETIIAVDQSLSGFAYTVYHCGDIAEYGVIRTGSSSNKTKHDTVNYFCTVEEQIHYICKEFFKIVDTYDPDKFIFEALSYGSVGNASRDLAMLLGGVVESLFMVYNYTVQDIVFYQPTKLKAFARTLLPEDEQTTFNSKNKPVKIKMDKNMMVKAVSYSAGEEYLKGYSMSGKYKGKDDLADSYLLLKMYLEGIV